MAAKAIRKPKVSKKKAAGSKSVVVVTPTTPEATAKAFRISKDRARRIRAYAEDALENA